MLALMELANLGRNLFWWFNVYEQLKALVQLLNLSYMSICLHGQLHH
jgi:hypothetical protein